jgi:hypothetical protein
MSGQFRHKQGPFPTVISVVTNEGVVSFSPDTVAWLEIMQMAGKIDKWKIADPIEFSFSTIPEPVNCYIRVSQYALMSDEQRFDMTIRPIHDFDAPNNICCEFSFLNIDFVLTYHIIDDENTFILAIYLRVGDDGIKYEGPKGNVDNNNIIVKLVETHHRVKTFEEIHLIMKNLVVALLEHVDIVAKKQIKAHNNLVKNLREWN